MNNRMLSKPLEQREIVPGPPLVPVHLEIATGRVVPQIVHNVKKETRPLKTMQATVFLLLVTRTPTELVSGKM